MRAIIDQDYTDIRLAFIEAKVFPLCGWDWLQQNIHRHYPEQKITISYNGRVIANILNTHKVTNKALKTIMRNCRS